MTKDRWLDLVAKVKERFTVTREGAEPHEEGPGTTTFVEFTGPLGEMRLEFDVHPAILGKKAVGGKRMGAGARVAYDYSPTDEVSSFSAWKKVDGEWMEIDGAMFAENA